MVRETGEGTARLLHSIANGEIDSREGASAQAKRALSRVSKHPPPLQTMRQTADALVISAARFQSLRQRSDSLIAGLKDGVRVQLQQASETHESLEHSVAILSEHAYAEQFRRKQGDGGGNEDIDEDLGAVDAAMKEVRSIPRFSVSRDSARGNGRR